MICPVCNALNNESAHVCHNCGANLHDSDPIANGPTYVQYEELLTTYNLGDIAIIKGVLEGEGIQHYVLGERFSHLYPQPAKIMVDKYEIEKAREIVDEFELAYLGMSLRDRDKYEEVRLSVVPDNPASKEIQIADFEDASLGQGSMATSMAKTGAKKNYLNKAIWFIGGALVGLAMAGFIDWDMLITAPKIATPEKFDNNKDSKIDEWRFYKEGALSTRRIDSNFDGKADIIITYENDLPVSQLDDLDFNGVYDSTTYYEYGIARSRDFHPNGSKNIHKRQLFEHGTLKEALIDKNIDGKFDERLMYDMLQNPIRTERIQ